MGKAIRLGGASCGQKWTRMCRDVAAPLAGCVSIICESMPQEGPCLSCEFARPNERLRPYRVEEEKKTKGQRRQRRTMEERGVQRVNSMFDTHPRWLSSSKAVAIRVITRLVAVYRYYTILPIWRVVWLALRAMRNSVALHDPNLAVVWGRDRRQ